jgi:hypothetical protein
VGGRRRRLLIDALNVRSLTDTPISNILFEEPSDTAAAKRAFVRTYSSRGFEDTWDIIEAFEEVQAVRAKYPERGSSFVAQKAGYPRSWIRRWVDDDAIPYPYQGLQTALSHGWLDLKPGNRQTRALVALVAYVLGKGSLKGEKYEPRASAGWRVTLEELHEAFAAVGVDSETVLTDDPERPPQVRPTTDGSVLGRVLYILGVPAGREDRRRTRLPSILNDIDIQTRARFCEVFVRQRGIDSHYESFDPTRVLVDRPERFRREFAALVANVTGEEAEPYSRGVEISLDGMVALGVDPRDE